MEYSLLRIWKHTLRKLHMIRGFTGESMIQIIERLSTQELKKLKEESKDDE